MSVCRECCVLFGIGPFDGLIRRPEEPYRMCCECDRQASIMRRPWPTGDCCATEKKCVDCIITNYFSQYKCCGYYFIPQTCCMFGHKMSSSGEYALANYCSCNAWFVWVLMKFSIKTLEIRRNKKCMWFRLSLAVLYQTL
jgi:hypothetical protein